MSRKLASTAIALTAAALTVLGLPDAARVSEAADDSSAHMIKGRITVDEAAKGSVSEDDRLVIRLYYPDDGISKDESFRIAKTFSLPLDFQIGPALDMSRRTKWPAYMVEVFTDKDNDVASRVEGELRAHSQALVPLGTNDLHLELAVD